MATIFVSGLEFYGYHGVSEEERRIGHRFVVDVRLEAEQSASATDRVEDTASYAEVANLILEVNRARSFATVERFASVALDLIHERFPIVSAAWIRIAKRLPPADFVADAVGVELRATWTTPGTL